VESAAVCEQISSRHEGVTVSFPWGMPGLDQDRYIVTVPVPGMPFYFLRGADRPEVGIMLVNPFAVFREYEFDLSEEVAGQLKITEPGQVAVLCTVNTSRGFESATANMMAPIVINIEKMLARQVVLHDSGYSLRQPLFPNTEAKGE